MNNFKRDHASEPTRSRKKLIEPFAQGMEASIDERTLAHNPYVAGSGANAEWSAGYAEAELDWQQFVAEQKNKKRTHPAFP